MDEEAKAAAKKKAKKEKKEAAKAEAKAKKEAKEKAKKAKGSVLKADLAVAEDLDLLAGDEVGRGVLKVVSPAAVAESKAKLAYLQAKDDERKLKLEAKNGLEAYLYMVKNKVEDELETISQVSTEEQREALLAMTATVLEWLDDDGYDAKTELYHEKKASVQELADPLFFRHTELSARPETVAMARKRVKDIKLLVAKWVDSMPQVTEEEREEVLASCEKVATWLDEKEEAQAKAEPHEAPVFTSTEVNAQLKPTANLVTRLSRKPKPKPPPVVLNTTNSTDDANSTAAGDSNSTVTPESSPDGAEDSKSASEKDSGKESKSTEAGEDEL